MYFTVAATKGNAKKHRRKWDAPGARGHTHDFS